MAGSRGAGPYKADHGATAVFARSRLAPPSRRVWLCTEGWLVRDRRAGDLAHVARRTARVVVYQTRPDVPLVFTLRGAASRTPRSVRVRSGGRVLASWTVAPGPAQAFVTTSVPTPRRAARAHHRERPRGAPEPSPRRHLAEDDPVTASVCKA